MSGNKSATKVLDVLEVLMNGDFDGATIEQIGDACGQLYPTVRRALHTLQQYDLATEYTVPGTKLQKWKLGQRLSRLASDYRVSALRAIQQVETEYFETTGKELKRA